MENRISNSSISATIQTARAHHHAGRWSQAESLYRQVLQAEPGNPVALHLSGILANQRGNAALAVELIRQALSIQPDYADAHYNLGNILQSRGETEAAVQCYRDALRIDPQFAEAHNNLGNALKDLGDAAEALLSYRRALSIRPEYAEAHFNLGNMLRECGDANGALASYRKALAIKPDYADAYSNLLFLSGYHGLLEPGEYLAQARGWEQACIPEPDRQVAHNRVFRHQALAGRRLRLGYVSGDYRTHAVSYYVEQLFAHHDRQRIELFAYSTCAQHDAVTSRLQTLAERWVPLWEGTDAALRDRIEADGIDVLVDLSGHTGHNRLGVFARRAAPVQAHYLGYFASTGLSEMDYWIGDETLTPPESDAHFSERVWRLPRVWVAYEGKTDAPAPVPQAEDVLRVGSFNHLGKLTPATLALWARVLHALPQAKLLLKTKALEETANRQRILDAMASHGISNHRIELFDTRLTPDWTSHMACYNRVDIALDPVGGIAGGTTTCDALWMGVPVVTQMGDRMASRMTASMFRALGHAEWIARTDDEYVEKVIELAHDAERRKGLRVALRSEMAQSALCDVRGLASSLENAYFEMYERWQRLANP